MKSLQVLVLLVASCCMFWAVKGQVPATPLQLVQHSHTHWHPRLDGRALVHTHPHLHSIVPTPGTVPPISPALNILTVRASLGSCSGLRYVCNFVANTQTFAVNVTCINLSQVCDGTTDCPMGDDEGTCTTSTSTTTASTTSSTSSSTSSSSSTTTSTTSTTTAATAAACSSGSVVCINGTCATPCNGVNECADLSDESNCPCNVSTQVRCVMSATSQLGCATLCNGTQECLGNEDEGNCACTTTQIRCTLASTTNLGCATLCDGTPQCANATDEAATRCGGRCTALTQSWCILTATSTYGCATNCNGVTECIGNTDEVLSLCRCAQNFTACARTTGGVGCVEFCNGVTECSDGSDENASNCPCANNLLSCESDVFAPLCRPACTLVPALGIPTATSLCRLDEDVRCGCPVGQARCASGVSACVLVAAACPP